MSSSDDLFQPLDTTAAPDPGVVFAALDAAASLEGDAVDSTGVIGGGQERADTMLLARRAAKNRTRLLRFGILAVCVAIGLGFILVRHSQTKKPLDNSKLDASQRYNDTSVPLGNISGGGALALENTPTLSVNGQLNISDGLVLTPGGKPANPVTGQLYYDKTTQRLSYYDGKAFVNVLSGQGGGVVEGIGSASGKITLGQGVIVTNNVLSNNGVLTLQGETGNVVFASGSGISINGTTVSNTGVLSVAGQVGDITLGNGLKAVGTQLQNSGVISATAGNNIAITDDGNGNIIISATGGVGTGVTSPGGTTGTIAVFTGTQTIADSLLSQSAGAVTVSGNLAVTGSISLASPLSVSQGGTGQASLPAGSVLLGNGTSALGSVSGTNGQCLIIIGGTPTFTSCPGAAGVDGSGTGGTIALWNGSGTVSTLTSSILSQDSSATTVSISGALSVSGAISAASLSGNGSAVTNVNAITLGGNSSSFYANAGNISTGTLNDGRLSSNVALRNADNNFTGTNLQHNGNAVCDTSGNCVGSGAGGGIGGGGTANQIAMFNGSGYTIGDSILSQDAGATTITATGALQVTGSVTAVSFSGNGASITNVNAAQLGGQAGSFYTNASNTSTGTLDNARLSPSVTLQGNTFNGANQLVQLNGSGFLPALNASLLTDVNATNISTGTLNDSRLSSNVALYNNATSNFTGSLQHNGNAVCDTSGNCVGSGSGVGGSGTANQIALFTGSGFSIGDSILSQDVGATTVSIGGDLSVSGTVDATNLSGNGSGVTNVNAAQLGGNSSTYYTNAGNISTGTLNDSRLSPNVALLNANNNFTGTTLQHNGQDICDTSNNCDYLTGGAADGAYIQLQTGTPGIAQTGHINISGTAIAGSVKATTIYQNGNAVCDTSGNCVGSGAGGGIGGGGTANQIAMFNGSGYTIGDSILSQDSGATTVSIGGDLSVSGSVSATSLSGDGASVTNVNAARLSGQNGSYYTDASNINSGVLGDTYLSTNVTLQGNTFNGVNQLVKLNGSGYLPALNGSLLTAVDAATLQGQAGSYYTNASNLSSGTLDNARLNTDVALYDNTTSNFTGALQQNGSDVCTIAGNCTGTGSGGIGGGGTANQIAMFNGSGYTIGDSILSQTGTTVTVGGTLAATNLSGDGSGVTNVDAATLGGNASNYYTNASNITSGTLSNSQLTASVTLQGNTFNGANQLLMLNGSGYLPALNGSLLTAVDAATLQGQNGSYYTDASNISTGTLNDSRLSPNVALLNANNNFTGTTLQHNGQDICDASGNCAGAGGGVTNGGINGTANTIAMFTGANTIADSILSQSGTTANVAGNLAASGTSNFTGTVSLGNTTTQGTLLFYNTSNTHTVTLTATADSAANQYISIPTSNQITDTICLQLLNNCAGSPGVQTIGAIDGGTYSANGASISGSTIYLQTASNTQVGLVNTGAQTFAGDKTFNGNLAVISSATTSAATSITANSLTSGSALNISTTSGGNTSANTVNISDTGTATTPQSQNGSELNVNRSLTANISTTPAITLDSTSSFTRIPNGTSATWSHTVGAGVNRYLVVTLSMSCSGGCVSSVTYNGKPLTRQVTKTQTGSSEIWTLKNPDSGTHNIVANFSLAYGVFGASSWTNVDQTNPIDSTTAIGAANGIITGSVSSSNTDMVIDNVEATYPATLAAQAGQTTIVAGAGGSAVMLGASSYKAGTTTSTTMAESSSSQPSTWAYTIISLKRSAGTLQISGAVANLQSSCTVATGNCNDMSNILNLKQQYAGATGAVATLQNAGSGDMIDFLSGSGTIVAKFDASGNLTANSVNSVTGYSYNGATGSTTTCSSGQFLQNQVVQGGITTGGTCAAGGVTTIGAIDGGTYSANGASISGSTIYLQTASNTQVGLVNTGAQSFTGLKTFSSGATVTGALTQSGGNFSLTGTGTSSLTAGGSLFLNAAGTSKFLTTSGDLTLGTSATTGNVIIQSTGGGATSSVSIGDNTVPTITIGNTSNTTRSISIGNGNISTNATVNLGSMGTVNIGATGSAAYSNTTNINNTTSGTGTQIVNLGSSANAANALTLEAGNTGQIQIGNGTTAHTIQIGTGTATQAVMIGSTSGASATTIQGGTGNVSFLTNSASASIIAKTGTNSTTGFQIQDASSVALFNADTTTGTITLGNAASGNYITFTAAGGLVASGTAQHTKTIALNAEYAGGVLDAQNDSTCTSATNGTMTSGYDGTNGMSYYDWAGNASAQCYDVVVRITLPSDFNGWSGSTPLTLKTYTNNNTTGLLNVDLRDTTNTSVAGCVYASATPGSNSTWTAAGSSCSFSGGTYTAGGVITVRIRMTASPTDDVRIGDMSLSYKSKF